MAALAHSLIQCLPDKITHNLFTSSRLLNVTKCFTIKQVTQVHTIQTQHKTRQITKIINYNKYHQLRKSQKIKVVFKGKHCRFSALFVHILGSL